MSDIFVSYANDDRDRVEPLVKALEEHEWTVWWDAHIPIGRKFPQVIKEELDSAEAVIVVWSKSSVNSEWVQDEAAEGNERNILLPVMIDEVKAPFGFKRLQAANLVNWNGQSSHPGLNVLVKGISGLLGRPIPSTPTVNEGGILIQEALAQEKPKFTPEQIERMVMIPKGRFLYGQESLQRVTIDYDYFLDVYPVTNQYYAQFIHAGGYNNKEFWSEEGWNWKETEMIVKPEWWEDSEWNIDNHPVVGISYFEAEAFANWAGKRLPTEQEWEKAARGINGRKYPWGNTFDETKCNSAESKIEITTPVEKYTSGISPFDCYDMGGNVWDWCASWSDESKQYRVVRGGSWKSKAGDLRSGRRPRSLPGRRAETIGFRCAKDP